MTVASCQLTRSAAAVFLRRDGLGAFGTLHRDSMASSKLSAHEPVRGAGKDGKLPLRPSLFDAPTNCMVEPLVRRLRRLLFWLSRTRPMGIVVRLAFGRLWWLLPVRRVAQTAGVLAFEHPAPTWQPHILLVPKRAIRSLLAATPADARLVGEVVRLGMGLALRRNPADPQMDTGFALLVNGGAYQDVPQLHFHLAGLDDNLHHISPMPPTASEAREAPTGPMQAQTATLRSSPHPRPQRAVHVVIWPADERLVWRDLAGPRGEQIGRELVPLVQQVVRQLGIGAAGFTLLASVPPTSIDSPVCFHLVAGDRQV